MLAGWTPRHDDVVRFLQWLAIRQWTPEELREPGLMRDLLASAGAPIPGVANAV
jgi:hypothetical protein